jgi:hypothetical protein
MNNLERHRLVLGIGVLEGISERNSGSLFYSTCNTLTNEDSIDVPGKCCSERLLSFSKDV